MLESLLIPMAKFLEHYTLVPAQCHLKPESLLIKRSPITKDSIKSLIDLIGEYLRSGGVQFSYNLLEAITGDHDFIRNHQDNVPEHVAYAASIFAPIICMGDVSVVPYITSVIASTNAYMAQRNTNFMELLLQLVSFIAIRCNTPA